MANGWQTIKLGEVLTERRETPSPESIETGEISIVSKISFNEGKIELRNETKTKTGMILIRPGDLVISGINAAKGAIAIHGETEKKSIAATIHYGAYIPNKDRVDIKYLWWFLRSAAFRDIVQHHIPGGIKTELKAKRLLAVPVPLPPLMEQRRIVARIEALAARVAVAQSLRREASEEVNHLINSAKSQIYSTDGNTTVKDFADIQSGYAFKSEWFSPDGIRLVRNVNIGHGDIRWDETARIPVERRGEFPSFELNEGDILISLDRPLISSGLKAARVRKQDLPSLLLQRVGRVIFKNNKVLPEFFFEWLHSPSFISFIDQGRSNGVPHISQKDIERIPFSPPLLEEQRRLVAYLDGLQAQVSALRAAQAETEKELSALMPSVLDRAFKGEL